MNGHKNRIFIFCLSVSISLLVSCSQPNPLDEIEEWDMVYISDSSGWGVPEKFAANIERDTGKQVVVHRWLKGGLHALTVLEDLQGKPALRSLPDDVAEAELIIFFANPRGEPEKGGINLGGIETCMDSRSCREPEDCSIEYYNSYVDNLKKIYGEIFALREGQATIFRAVDLYNPLISEHQECGTDAVCTNCWETFNRAVHQAAEAYGVPVVSVYDLFNGSNHDQDPREKGYIGADGEHTTEIGQQAIADLLSQSGYVPLIP